MLRNYYFHVEASGLIFQFITILMLTLLKPSRCVGARAVAAAAVDMPPANSVLLGKDGYMRPSQRIIDRVLLQEDPIEEDEITSFVGVFSQVHPRRLTAHRAAAADASASKANQQESDTSAGEVVDWEAVFEDGLQHSKAVVEGTEHCAWGNDHEASAGAPAEMLQAEELLQRAESFAPSERRREKTAERALRVFYHAKWLAERHFAKAAEHRYRQAADLARQSRRSVLASHALSRLGYFLVLWHRPDEARPVLEEAEKLDRKSNPLAPYLLGLLEREVSGSDVERLFDAEARILAAGKLPSEELEADRERLVHEIRFWRIAETSFRRCLEAPDVVFAVVCLWAHAFRGMEAWVQLVLQH